MCDWLRVAPSPINLALLRFALLVCFTPLGSDESQQFWDGGACVRDGIIRISRIYWRWKNCCDSRGHQSLAPSIQEAKEVGAHAESGHRRVMGYYIFYEAKTTSAGFILGNRTLFLFHLTSSYRLKRLKTEGFSKTFHMCKHNNVSLTWRCIGRKNSSFKTLWQVLC